MQASTSCREFLPRRADDANRRVLPCSPSSRSHELTSGTKDLPHPALSRFDAKHRRKSHSTAAAERRKPSGSSPQIAVRGAPVASIPNGSRRSAITQQSHRDGSPLQDIRGPILTGRSLFSEWRKTGPMGLQAARKLLLGRCRQPCG